GGTQRHGGGPVHCGDDGSSSGYGPGEAVAQHPFGGEVHGLGQGKQSGEGLTDPSDGDGAGFLEGGADVGEILLVQGDVGIGHPGGTVFRIRHRGPLGLGGGRGKSVFGQVKGGTGVVVGAEEQDLCLHAGKTSQGGFLSETAGEGVGVQEFSCVGTEGGEGGWGVVAAYRSGPGVQQFRDAAHEGGGGPVGVVGRHRSADLLPPFLGDWWVGPAGRGGPIPALGGDGDGAVWADRVDEGLHDGFLPTTYPPQRAERGMYEQDVAGGDTQVCQFRGKRGAGLQGGGGSGHGVGLLSGGGGVSGGGV